MPRRSYRRRESRSPASGSDRSSTRILSTMPVGPGHAHRASGATRPLRVGALAARLQVDDELAVERVGDAKQRVDAGRPPATLEPGDRGLRRADQLGQLALRQPALLAPLG